MPATASPTLWSRSPGRSSGPAWGLASQSTRSLISLVSVAWSAPSTDRSFPVRIEGEPASVSLIASGGLVDLGLNRQNLLRGRTPAYLGGETFWPHPRAEEAIVAARAAIAALAVALPGVRGYLGVDLVLGPSGATVIEVNPRLTTSYVGLRRSIRENLAALILDAAAGRALPDRVTPAGRCRFRADGSTAMRRGGWATSSDGTSAASI